YHGYGDELWSTNGTAGGTKIVKDINKGPYGSNIYLTAAVAVDTLLYFEAADGITEGLWKSDGTAKGTQLVKNVLPASTFQYPYPMVGINDRLFFVDFYDSLWTSDGTDSGTYSIKDPVLSNLSNIYDLISLGNKIFFTGYTDAAGQELYIGDLSNMNNKPTGNFASVAVLKNNSLIVFPNPTKDILNVTIGTSIKSNAQIFITDASGKTVLNTALTNGSTFMQLNVSHLAQGTYFIKLISADGSVNASGKFVKQ
ncbi:MAG TPA: T9SS type A sorting domain-containing protein, partial [Parafilimonas sp.]|nr:T9SS type A sorting domain-containing protein [Parafilimonas sp.]